MWYWLRLLFAADVTPVLVNTHYLAKRVVEYVQQSSFGSRVVLVHEEVLLETAGTLYRNREFFKGGPAMLIHGDNLSVFNVRAFQNAYMQRPSDVEITMMTFETTAPKECGIVELDERGVVRGFHEKVAQPPGRLANGAVYIVSPNVIDSLGDFGKEIIDFSTEVIPRFLGKINVFHNSIYHRDIGTPESLAAAQLEFPSVLAQYSYLLDDSVHL